MTEPISFGELDCKMTVSMADDQAKPQAQTPFRIAVIGDFSGRASRGQSDPGQMRPIMVDRDNVDDLIAKLAVEVHLSLDDKGDSLAIKFEELDDFHPDELFRRLGIFKSLRQLRKGLGASATFAAAASEVKSWFPTEKKAVQPNKEKKTQAAGSLLDQIVADVTGETLEPQKRTNQVQDGELASFLNQVVTPHLVPADDPQKDDLIAVVDRAVSQVMQAILHHPEFQEIEAAWRGIDFLTKRLDTGVDLQVYLCDMSKDELTADLLPGADLSATTFYNRFVLQAVETMGGEPWSLLAGCYHFNQEKRDVEILARIAKIARQAGAPFIAGAQDQILGCEMLAATPDPTEWQNKQSSAAWEALRAIPEAAYLGLVLPGFMLRLPYGHDTAPIDMFDFEEYPSEAGHHGYLWGNSALACAFLLGHSFSQNGWQMRHSLEQDIISLPVHFYKAHGETRVMPCAEVVMTERAASAIMDKGVMPLLAFQGEDRARLPRFQSITKPLSALSGRWY